MSERNLESALEQHLDTLGTKLEGTIEEWREASVQEREAIEGRIKSIENTMAEMKSNLEEERRAHLPGVAVASQAQEKEAFSLGRACRAIAKKDFSYAPYEKEVFDNMNEKAMSVGTDTAGGFIVPEEAILSVIEKLKSRVVAYELGARDMAVSGVPVVLPRMSTSATASWVSENATIAASDAAFQQLSLTPKTAAGRVVLSNLLLETSNPAADRIIEEDLGSQLGIAVDSAALIGGGAGQPMGIISTAGVGTVAGVAAGSIVNGIDKLIDFEQDLQNADAYGGRLGWAIHPSVLGAIREMVVDGAGTSVPLGQQVVSEGYADSILGHPYATTTSLTAFAAGGAASATNSIIFGNWEDLMIARWGGLRLMASNTSDDAFSKDQTHIRGTIRVDVGLRHTESFSFAS
jgi:HK97 family phage major capsid protein